jgi:hypothetical protein
LLMKFYCYQFNLIFSPLLLCNFGLKHNKNRTCSYSTEIHEKDG